MRCFCSVVFFCEDNNMMIQDKNMILEGAGVTLRPMTKKDSDNVLRWRNDPAVVKNFIYREIITKEEHSDWFANKIEKGLVHQFIIVVNETHKEIGSIYLHNFNDNAKSAEWGIFIGDDKDVYGKGYGTESAKLLLNYAFETLMLHKVTSRVLAYNIASIRMNEKAGYIQEGYLRDEYLFDGQYVDLILFGVINEQ